jgi:hypothetical protein
MNAARKTFLPTRAGLRARGLKAFGLFVLVLGAAGLAVASLRSLSGGDWGRPAEGPSRWLAAAPTGSADGADGRSAADSTGTKQVLGATAVVAETQSDLVFAARVDTGATTCSVHVEAWEIFDESAEMAENVGKSIRFLVRNHQDDARWVVSKIAELATIKTSEREELRYKVPMTLVCKGISKNVLVSLNDRAHMKYPMLVGRNFLEDDFLVDVSSPEASEPVAAAGRGAQVADNR